ncbi:hypothetical protein [Weissella soli]|uniref:Uncharacterized protein n=1 Tax=Weissella soli TaxID=155866 RepID=A0A288QV65_9LACO|nr:hypothetical protein [Weissella soli]AOT57008.1 Chitinase [Weissella soli]NKY83459.1 hypothetical protein [Weissella soli]RDL05249.1 hypothetical protein DFP99_1198 [Weissella soli]GEN93710.1 hypothetical protein WSO01_13220 [Weissella soli]
MNFISKSAAVLATLTLVGTSTVVSSTIIVPQTVVSAATTATKVMPDGDYAASAFIEKTDNTTGTGTGTASTMASMWGGDATTGVTPVAISVKDDVATVTLSQSSMFTAVPNMTFDGKAMTGTKNGESTQSGTWTVDLPANTLTNGSTHSVSLTVDAGPYGQMHHTVLVTIQSGMADLVETPTVSSSATSASVSSSSSVATATSDKTATDNTTATSTAAKVNNTLAYSVLQADKQSVSAANDFYTKEATYVQNADGTYTVSVQVFEPSQPATTFTLASGNTHGEKIVSEAAYTSNGMDGHLLTYSFNVAALDDLNALIAQQIHVKVDGIEDNDYAVYLQFKAISTTGATTPVATPAKNATTSSTSAAGVVNQATSAKANTASADSSETASSSSSDNALPTTAASRVSVLGVTLLMAIAGIFAAVKLNRRRGN